MAILIAVYSVLMAAVILVDAAWWLMTALAMLTLPALWDLWRDPSAGLRLGETGLDWHTGQRSGALLLTEINHMRFDTRWDFSVRVTAVLENGKLVRLPYEALPPHRAFETALEVRKIAVKRHHFTVF
jgi:hypothetical protein